jgi:hypothetical protein
MGWFRSNRCSVVRLALFALACQFVLAFGHVHLGKISAGSDGLAIVALATAADVGSSSADASSSAPPKKPAGLADVFCPVCASIGMAGTLVAPTSPAVAPPVSASQHLRWSSAAIDPQSFDHLLFDARGPPLA